MKSKKVWSGIAVLALSFGLVLAGCDNGTTGGDTAGGGKEDGSGTLTITGLGDHEGWYVVADNDTSSDISGVYRLIAAASSMSSNSSVTGVEISGGQAVLKVYNYQGGGKPYTGSAQGVRFTVFVKSSSSAFNLKDGDGQQVGTVTVNFSSGTGTTNL